MNKGIGNTTHAMTARPMVIAMIVETGKDSASSRKSMDTSYQ